MRIPSDLDAAINNHKTLHGEDPLMVSVQQTWHRLNASYFNGKVHVLCCGKGMLYRGIPLIITTSKQVQDFLIAY